MLLRFSNRLIVFLAGATLLLSSCADTENTESSSKHENKAKTDKSELDGLLLAAPELTLKEAIKKYARGSKKNLNDLQRSQRLTIAASKAADMGDNDAAETLLTEAIRLDDKNGQAFYQRGKVRCNGVKGKDSDAIEDFKKAISFGAGGAGAHEFLGRVYDSSHQPDKAIEALTTAIKMDPTSKDPYKSRAALYTAMGEKEKALKDYDMISKIDPTSALAQFRKGQVLESLKRKDEARAAYEKVVVLDQPDAKVPLKAIALKRLAALNSERGKHVEAIENLTKAADFDAADDEPLRLRGLEYATLKNYKKAADDLSKAIEISPDAVSNFTARADVYTKMGKVDLAQKDRSEAKRLQDVPAERPIYELKHEQ